MLPLSFSLSHTQTITRTHTHLCLSPSGSIWHNGNPLWTALVHQIFMLGFNSTFNLLYNYNADCKHRTPTTPPQSRVDWRTRLQYRNLKNISRLFMCVLDSYHGRAGCAKGWPQQLLPSSVHPWWVWRLAQLPYLPWSLLLLGQRKKLTHTLRHAHLFTHDAKCLFLINRYANRHTCIHVSFQAPNPGRVFSRNKWNERKYLLQELSWKTALILATKPNTILEELILHHMEVHNAKTDTLIYPDK